MSSTHSTSTEVLPTLLCCPWYLQTVHEPCPYSTEQPSAASASLVASASEQVSKGDPIPFAALHLGLPPPDDPIAPAGLDAIRDPRTLALRSLALWAGRRHPKQVVLARREPVLPRAGRPPGVPPRAGLAGLAGPAAWSVSPAEVNSRAPTTVLRSLLRRLPSRLFLDHSSIGLAYGV